MRDILDTVLLLALPASGKSEIRRYLASLPPVGRRELHLGETVQLDDYPYVHLMRRLAQELSALGEDPVFFADDTQPFLDDRDWGTLTILLDEDYQALRTGATVTIEDPARWLLDRLDGARLAVGAPAAFSKMRPSLRRILEEAIEGDARRLASELPTGPVGAGHTVILEAARGGPKGATLPLDPPYGYRYSLSLMTRELLERAVILYVWVTPEESRRKNRERAVPGADGSILHHGVPEAVMDAEYGLDDMGWLLEHSELPGTITIEAHGEVFHLPTVRFDNRVDHTSFLREDPERWPKDAVESLHRELIEAFDALAHLAF